MRNAKHLVLLGQVTLLLGVAFGCVGCSSTSTETEEASVVVATSPDEDLKATISALELTVAAAKPTQNDQEPITIAGAVPTLAAELDSPEPLATKMTASVRDVAEDAAVETTYDAQVSEDDELSKTYVVGTNGLVEFDLESDLSSPPFDVLKEAFYFSGGGGGSPSCPRGINYPRDVKGVNVLETVAYPEAVKFSESELVIDYAASEMLRTCGWAKPGSIDVRIFAPDGSMQIDVTQAKQEEEILQSYGIGSVYTPIISVPVPGRYEVILEMESQLVEYSILVDLWSSPALFQVTDVSNPLEQQGVLVVGFEPFEQFTIFAYEFGGALDGIAVTLVGWQELKADERGNLFIAVPHAEQLEQPMIAIGEATGEARFLLNGFTVDQMYISGEDSACEGAPPTRLSVGDTAQVVVEALSVRSGPATRYPKVYGQTLSRGRDFFIINGSICNEGMRWWYGESGIITLTNGEKHNIVGWVAEESGDEWLLEPVR